MLDQLDRRILDVLYENPRIRNNALAKQLGIAETTAASRLRKLKDDRAMVIALSRDVHGMGFDLQCFVEVSVHRQKVERVADDLAKLNSVNSVAILMGRPEILLVISAVDRHDLSRILTEEIGRIAGVKSIDVHVATNIRKLETRYADLKADYNA